MSRGGTVTPNGEAIKRLRVEKGWDLTALAGKAGYSRPTISDAEKSKPCYPFTLKGIADALGVKVGAILAGDPEPPQPAIQQGKAVRVNVTIEIPFDQFSQCEQLLAFIERLKSLMPARGELEVAGVAEGSTVITLEMSPGDYHRLMAAFEDGLLEGLGVTDVVVEKPKRSELEVTGAWARNLSTDEPRPLLGTLLPIGKRIEELRNQLGQDLEELAETSHIPTVTLKNAINSQPVFAITLKNIAHALHVQPSTLLQDNTQNRILIELATLPPIDILPIEATGSEVDPSRRIQLALCLKVDTPIVSIVDFRIQDLIEQLSHSIGPRSPIVPITSGPGAVCIEMASIDADRLLMGFASSHLSDIIITDVVNYSFLAWLDSPEGRQSIKRHTSPESSALNEKRI